MTRAQGLAVAAVEAGDMRLAAKIYRDCGLAPIPLHSRSKKPIHHNCPSVVTDDDTQWSGNIGVKCGVPSNGMVDLDLDCREAQLLAPEVMPPTVACFGRESAPCSHWLYHCEPPPEATQQWIGDNGVILEIRSTGGQTMFPPSIHPCGEEVTWHRQGEAAWVEPPELLRAAGILAAVSLLMQHWPAPEARLRYHAWGAMIGCLLRCGVAVETVERVVQVFVDRFPPGRANKKSRLRAPAALRDRLDRGTGRVPGFNVLKGVFGERVADLCREWLPRRDAGEEGAVLSEQWLALKFVAEHRDALAYTPVWDRWHHWDGAIWRRDDRLMAFSAASQFCRRAAKTTTEADEARRLCAAHTRAAVVSLAKEQLVVPVDAWNADPWLLGTPGGIWDLRTGESKGGSRDFVNRAVRAVPTWPNCCPLWIKTIGEIFQGKKEMIDYAQRLAGYCLTGLVREEVLIFLYGAGGNGKGTFIETLLYAMGDYGVTIPMTTLVETRHPEHPTEIAKLCGARLAVASETKEGNYWDTGRIKALTGGDRLTGRFMRQDYFDFDPTHTLVVSSNNRPSLAQVDDALRRRVQEVPFRHRFDKPDLKMKERLKREAPDIIGWMVEGCLQWQEKGLDPPAEIRESSEENLTASDDLNQFVQDCCATSLTVKTASARFYRGWVKWCETRGRYAGPQRDFTRRMQEKWPQYENTDRGVVFLGLKIADEREP